MAWSVVQQQCTGSSSNADQKHQDVAALVAKGDCEGARQTALDCGDMDLAEQAQRLCAPKP
jgi:hypothetical protein